MPVDKVGSVAVYEVLRPIALAGKHATVKVAGAAMTAVLEWARINEFRADGSPVETVRRATWDQFDLEAAVWVKPAEATKTAKSHRVPLSRQALDVLAEARKGYLGALVFPGTRPGTMFGNSVMTQALRTAGIAASGHGFRSSFKDWARQQDVDELLSEFALAHVEGSATVAAYARDDLLEKRRPVMQEWADCIAGEVASFPNDIGPSRVVVWP